MTLGQRIQELRKSKGLSQEQLGELLGVSRQAVSRWEMDGAVPEVDKLISLSRVFSVDLNDLLQVERQGEQPSPAPQASAAPACPKYVQAAKAATGVFCAAMVLSNLMLWGQVNQLKQQLHSLNQSQIDVLLPDTPKDFDPILLDLEHDLAVVPGETNRIELPVSFSLPDSFDMEGISVHLMLTTDSRPVVNTGFVPMERDQKGVYRGCLSLDYPADANLDANVLVYFSGESIKARSIRLYELVYYPNTNNSKVLLTYLP